MAVAAVQVPPGCGSVPRSSGIGGVAPLALPESAGKNATSRTEQTTTRFGRLTTSEPGPGKDWIPTAPPCCLQQSQKIRTYTRVDENVNTFDT